ncbi:MULTISPECIES: prefoldin subunit beta [Methanosphaera]|nr:MULTISPECIES: prefoldin subunit beta [Methanosphaera]MDO5821859.1 prefoldin subunit beta [Methanosphaera sp.]MEE0489582.1 prefoldin subunit beta [Methanosphaera stadtmanae]OEC92850.1 prefoldin subunit beta [Methanosphaera sp. A6]RAP02677.1 prefoldin subunit beta [Methanosphaera stadtmanae]RAP46508.1 MAG: prefoldin subunit beta [Methanosphaera sp. DEW79]
MDMPQNIQEQLNQFQQVQQQAQSIAMQKQTLTLQINESKKALDELSKTADDQDVYKTAGPLLIKTTKTDSEADLKDSIEMLEIRQKTIEKQEKRITGKLEELQKNLQEAMSQMKQ